jgi:hypothetical protein
MSKISAKQKLQTLKEWLDYMRIKPKNKPTPNKQ